jgi:hypothetical protein
MKFTKSWAAAGAMVALTGAAQAALVLQANGLEVLDTNTNLIWLKNWNLNGLQTWAAQKAWAETTLDGFAGSNDWRLPDIAEYANLFTAYGDLTSNTLPFVNVQPRVYWSGTELASGISAWGFTADSGGQGFGFKTNQFFAVAVRPGDVTATVPEPQTLALALLALGATLVVRKRRPA